MVVRPEELPSYITGNYAFCYLTTYNRNGSKLVVFELPSQLSNLKWSAVILSALRSRKELILVKCYNTVCREKLNLLKKEAEFRTLQLSIVAAAGANIAASVSY